jgi:3-phosphoshikimate 1-carboxyvinyltransferase
MGIKTESTNDSLTVYGGSPKSADIETYHDHRMAMSFAVAGTKIPGIVIENPEVVQKSFPDFWGTLGKIGIEVQEKYI